MTNMDMAAELKSILKNVVLDDKEAATVLAQLCRCYQSEVDRLMRDSSRSAKRIDSLVYGWEAKNAEVGRLMAENAALLVKLEGAEEYYSRYHAETTLSLEKEILNLKSRLYNVLLSEGKAPRPLIKLVKDA